MLASPPPRIPTVAISKHPGCGYSSDLDIVCMEANRNLRQDRQATQVETSNSRSSDSGSAMVVEQRVPMTCHYLQDTHNLAPHPCSREHVCFRKHANPDFEANESLFIYDLPCLHAYLSSTNTRLYRLGTWILAFVGWLRLTQILSFTGE